jgi:hypothetical protein
VRVQLQILAILKSAEYLLSRRLGDSNTTLEIFEKRIISCPAPEVNCNYSIFQPMDWILYRVTQKNRELLKNPTKIEEIQEKKFIDRN